MVTIERSHYGLLVYRSLKDNASPNEVRKVNHYAGVICTQPLGRTHVVARKGAFSCFEMGNSALFRNITFLTFARF